MTGQFRSAAGGQMLLAAHTQSTGHDSSSSGVLGILSGLANGKVGDHWYTVVVVHEQPTFTPQIDAAIRQIAGSRGERPYHPETRDYIARKHAEGKTNRDAVRCLKRHLTRRIWHLLQPPTPIPNQTITPTSLT